MAIAMVWENQDTTIVGTDNNLFLGTDLDLDIDVSPLALECGEVISSGEKFCSVGTSGSAGFPNFDLVEGSLTYIGRSTVTLPWRGPDNTALMILFDSQNEFGESMLPALRMHLDTKHAYLAFFLFDGGKWAFINSAGSSRVIITDRLVRGVRIPGKADRQPQMKLGF